MRATKEKIQLAQAPLPGLSLVSSAVEELAGAGTDDRGAIFTRREVVNFILDLAGYVPSLKLQTMRLLEPSFGEGDFLIPAIERLMTSLKRQKIEPEAELLKKSIHGVELHIGSFDKTKGAIRSILLKNNLSPSEADEVLNEWLIRGDFLLTHFDHKFTHVVGNPPYIRQESIPPALMMEYRRRFETIYDRADIYIPFIEYSLNLLDNGGALGFICADRWMKNRYGGPLRKLIASQFHLRTYVDMVGTAAFHSEVIAYPAITVIAKEATGPTKLAKRPEINASVLQELAEILTRGSSSKDVGVRTTTIMSDGSPWTLGDSEALALVQRLERDFPSLEEADCKVGIGVATGADNVFIAPFEALDVEPDRKLPLIMTKDIQEGKIAWRGLGVINPFDNNGKLVPLADYPKLRAYLSLHEETIKKRHVSKKNPTAWYRTIDRIYTELVTKPKLLIPDIKQEAHVIYDKGGFYPHHNFYHITSDEWDLEALKVVLLSGIAKIFIETYSTRMHGDCLRFQAQYLRRIRLPRWSSVPANVRCALKAVVAQEDPAARDLAVAALYSLSPSERAIMAK